MAERESTVAQELLARPRLLGAGYGSMLKKDFLRNRSIYLMALPVVAFSSSSTTSRCSGW